MNLFVQVFGGGSSTTLGLFSASFPVEHSYHRMHFFRDLVPTSLLQLCVSCVAPQKVEGPRIVFGGDATLVSNHGHEW